MGGRLQSRDAQIERRRDRREPFPRAFESEREIRNARGAVQISHADRRLQSRCGMGGEGDRSTRWSIALRAAILLRARFKSECLLARSRAKDESRLNAR